MKISKHISLKEATQSQTATRLGIKNEPTAEIIERMKLVAVTCFDPMREHFGVPIRVSSFYRCEKLNAAIGGSKTSQHVRGEAIDIQAISGTGINNKAIFEYLKTKIFDQLIWEYGDNNNPAWVHISFTKINNRNQILYIPKTLTPKK